MDGNSEEMKRAANEATVHLEAGKSYLRSNDFKRAMDAFSKAEAIDPHNAYVYFEKGNVYLRMNDREAALREYERSLSIDPSNDQTLLEAGKLYAQKGQLEKARSYYERAVSGNEKNAGAHLELGKALRLRGDWQASRMELERAFQLTPENRELGIWLKKADSAAPAKRVNPPYRVFFTWGMHYACNYKCSYCYTPRPEDKGFGATPKYSASYPGTPKVLSSWEQVAARYGNCRIRLDGGEPSLYPDFLNLVKGLSVMHSLQINTNLSFDVRSFIKEIKPDQVRIDASFHSEYMSAEEFAVRVKALKENGFRIITAFVAYPPFINAIAGCRKIFEDMAVPFIIHPYSGEYNGRSYPAGYSQEETRKIYHSDESSETELEWRKDGAGRGSFSKTECDAECPEKHGPARSGDRAGSATRSCRMGQMYARIYPDGSVYRCCTDDGLMRLGNLYEGGFSLLDEAAPCDNKKCRCWRCMVPGEEDRWLGTWLDDWEMPF